MSHFRMQRHNSVTRLLPVILAAAAALFTATAQAAVPGVQGPKFSLAASEAYTTQPDGQLIYSWGYGCTGTATMLPGSITSASCPVMQIPGPTLIVTEGTAVTVTLINNLPVIAGNTSILFPGFAVTATASATQPATCSAPTAPAPQGLLTVEAAPGCSVDYTFTPNSPGTRAYYSGTQADLQIEMGMYGAVVVLPSNPIAASVCKTNPNGGGQFALSTSAYDAATPAPASAPLPNSCYDREYLFQLAEVDPRIHAAADQQAHCSAANSLTPCPTSLSVPIEPYRARYFLINGRSMPDDMDANFAPPYPHQPYNGNPHMHPGDQVLLRVIGQGRAQHPLHEHGNHVRILGRDGNMLVSQTNSAALAGPLLFTTTTTPGVAMDGIFYWSGRGLNWDVYDHTPGDGTVCIPDANGYYTSVPAAKNYYEWCADHDKPLETSAGGPATLPDPLVLTNGLWYGGSAYLGPDATAKSEGPTPLPPSSSPQNAGAGFAFMWHSHNEREITTNDIFPGGMMMMMIVDAPYVTIDETF
jgi:FtsP/CotA-like multicopper oxidase with cupredoxin domain